jgi:hypothetical protein
MAAITSRFELILGSSLGRCCHSQLLLHGDLFIPLSEGWGFGEAGGRLRRCLARVPGQVRNEVVGGFAGLIPLGCASRGRGFGIGLQAARSSSRRRRSSWKALR